MKVSFDFFALRAPDHLVDSVSEWHSLDGRDDVLVPKHDEVLNDALSSLGVEGSVVVEQEGREVGRELLGLLGVALRDLQIRAGQRE